MATGRRFNCRNQERARQLLSAGAVADKYGLTGVPGFEIDLYTSTPADEPVGLSVCCGRARPYLDSVHVTCSLSSPAYAEFAQRALLIMICELIAKHWEPDYGVVADHDLIGANFPETYSYEVGWITYRSLNLPAPDLPKQFERREVPGRGTLIVTVSEPFSSKRVRHVESVKELARLLPPIDRTSPTSPTPGEPVKLGPDDIPLALNLRWEPTPRNAPKFAKQMVKAARQISGVTLDYSPSSLHDVDKIIGQFRRERLSAEDIAESLFCFGCYVGEVFVRHAGGKWGIEPDVFGLAIRLGNDSWCNPIGKTFKRLENGAVDSLTYFYQCFTTSTD